MKQALSILLSVCLLLAICACGSNSVSIVGSWNTESSILGAENDAEEICIIFYDGFEGEETHTKDGTTYKSYQFDYETEGDVLTLHSGGTQSTYTITYGEQDGTDTMQLTAADGTVYSYVLRSRNTPGIYS